MLLAVQCDSARAESSRVTSSGPRGVSAGGGGPEASTEGRVFLGTGLASLGKCNLVFSVIILTT